METEDEALALIVLHCAYNGRLKCYWIPPVWPDQDVVAAIKEAKRQFQLEGKE